MKRIVPLAGAIVCAIVCVSSPVIAAVLVGLGSVLLWATPKK